MVTGDNHKKPLGKPPTGIHGPDEITSGGLPQGRTTLVCGSAGCGKTMLSVEFLVRCVLHYKRRVIFSPSKKSHKEINKNFASLDLSLADLIKREKMIVDYVHLDRA